MLTLGQLPAEAAVPDVTVIDHESPRPAAPQPGVTVEYGEYVASTCTVCHGSNLNGQMICEGSPEYLAPNLTPGGEVAFWSEADFITTLRTGITPSGKQLKDVMTWKYFGQMAEDDLQAVWLYLQSLSPLPQGK